MKDNINISVIVPVYNVEKYLSRCIDSILVQTYQNYELILINDGSPDNCAQIIEKYAKENSKIVVIQQDNQGLSAARNAGIDIARGMYITFIDSDDYVYPEYLERLVSAIERNDADISICGNVRFSDTINPEVKNNFAGEKVVTGIQACNYIYDVRRNPAKYVVAWGKVYKRELFLNKRYPVGKIHEDQFLTYRLMYAAKRVVEIGECLYGYYVNEFGIMNSPFSLNRYDNLEALEKAEQFFRNHNEQELIEKVKQTRSVLLAEYSIKARNAGIYEHVPEKYKLGFWEAQRKLKKTGGVERYDYIMYQFYPRLITFEARLRKIKMIISRKDK